ncbi:hypothetical protein EUGRSUZ_L03713 [Eucalyptus grandis]|uniref:Uncharacterized protein n=1 Tax=Eucalyptus grandis TaxID=71139 RepID=A0AAD9WI61_EUCGR|nr:hypothetical protein EUGRSUZ_L03713 [Eucalyptus grandis]
MWNSKLLLGTNSCARMRSDPVVKYPNQRPGMLVMNSASLSQPQSGTHALPVRSPTFSRFTATTSSSQSRFASEKPRLGTSKKSFAIDGARHA